MAVILKFHTYQKSCEHKNILVDEHRRLLECESCGSVVDPFEYFLDKAKKNQYIIYQVDGLNRKLNELTTNVDELKKEEKQLKSRINRLKRHEQIQHKT